MGMGFTKWAWRGQRPGSVSRPSDYGFRTKPLRIEFRGKTGLTKSRIASRSSVYDVFLPPSLNPDSFVSWDQPRQRTTMRK